MGKKKRKKKFITSMVILFFSNVEYSKLKELAVSVKYKF